MPIILHKILPYEIAGNPAKTHNLLDAIQPKITPASGRLSARKPAS